MERNAEIIKGSNFGHARGSISGIELDYRTVPQMAHLTRNDSLSSKVPNSPTMN